MPQDRDVTTEPLVRGPSWSASFRNSGQRASSNKLLDDRRPPSHRRSDADDRRLSSSMQFNGRTSAAAASDAYSSSSTDEDAIGGLMRSDVVTFVPHHSRPTPNASKKTETIGKSKLLFVIVLSSSSSSSSSSCSSSSSSSSILLPTLKRASTSATSTDTRRRDAETRRNFDRRDDRRTPTRPSVGRRGSARTAPVAPVARGGTASRRLMGASSVCQPRRRMSTKMVRPPMTSSRSLVVRFDGATVEHDHRRRVLAPARPPRLLTLRHRRKSRFPTSRRRTSRSATWIS